jgi:segregation and condensation protein A
MPVPEAPEAPEALDPNFRIELPNFEGPLDLLLHLIRKHELDILDLPISFITDKYLEYLGLMGNLNLDVASEYLVMAATLAHIKSKMLLPRPPADQEDDEVDQLDPRAELIRRLLEYQKYKTVARDLGDRAIAGRDVFSRGSPPPTGDGPPPLKQVSVFKLLDALKKIAERVNASISLEVDAERMSIQERIGGLVDLLRERRRCRFDELFEDVSTSYELVVTFLPRVARDGEDAIGEHLSDRPRGTDLPRVHAPRCVGRAGRTRRRAAADQRRGRRRDRLCSPPGDGRGTKRVRDRAGRHLRRVRME